MLLLFLIIDQSSILGSIHCKPLLLNMMNFMIFSLSLKTKVVLNWTSKRSINNDFYKSLHEFLKSEINSTQMTSGLVLCVQFTAHMVETHLNETF
jgi:hypothetical protein